MKKAIYSKDHKYLVSKLKEARKEAGLNQIKAAKILKTTQSYISKIESGQCRIDVIQLKEIAKVYKKKVGYFIK